MHNPHQLGISDVLAMLMLTGEIPPGLSLFGLKPQKMDTGLEMTPLIAGKIDLLVDLTINQLIDMGIQPEPIDVEITPEIAPEITPEMT